MKGKITWNLVLASSAAFIGSMSQFGYNLGVVNNAEQVVSEFINASYSSRLVFLHIRLFKG